MKEEGMLERDETTKRGKNQKRRQRWEMKHIKYLVINRRVKENLAFGEGESTTRSRFEVAETRFSKILIIVPRRRRS